MRLRLARLLSCVLPALSSGQLLTAAESAEGFDAPAAIESYRPVAARLIEAAQADAFAHRRLAELCDTFGARPAGTARLESAIDWILAQMKQDGLTRVHGEEVTVPCWVRGPESLELLAPRSLPLRVLGLGGTVATPPEGITAEVLVVRDFEELHRRAADARGKIVCFTLPFTEYGSTVVIRTRGAIEAARVGAVASLVRSITPFSMQTPHTGMMQYDESAAVPRIPHAAITAEDAGFLQRLQDRGQAIRVRLMLRPESRPDAVSRNVVAEVPGRELPEEVVLVGGHVDSWDVGQGAMDDGGGCLAAWEAARLMLKLNLRPRRTVRVVLWTGEEIGLIGAKAYRKQHSAELDRHVLGIESDRGTFAPQGFAFTGSERAQPWMKGIGRLLEPIQAGQITVGNGGMDVMQLVEGGVPVMDLVVERTRYFWFHHTDADTVDKVDPKELSRCAASLAVMAYVIADLPVRLPR